MSRLGPVWGSDLRKHSALVKDAYRPLLAQAPKGGVELTRNLAYGAHRRQVLDVFRPVGPGEASGFANPAADAGRGRPVAVFVHGGAFVRGDKCTDDEMYDNVLYWFARQGFLGINLEYRLAPEAPFPGGVDDVAAAAAWLHGNVGRFGGDPDRLFLIGHSAGGTQRWGIMAGMLPASC